MSRHFPSGFFFSVAFLLILLTSSHSFSEDLWRPFISKEGGVSVLMPTIPSFQKVSHKSFVGTVEENTYQSKSGAESFTIEYSDIPKTALFLSGPDTIFDETKEGLLNDLHGIQLQFESTTFQGNPGKLLTFKVLPQGKDSNEMIGKAKFILINQRLYVLVAITPRSSNSNHLDLFLNSFQKL